MSWFFQPDVSGKCGCDQKISAIESRIADLENKLKEANTRISGVSLAAGLRPKPKTEKAE